MTSYKYDNQQRYLYAKTFSFFAGFRVDKLHDWRRVALCRPIFSSIFCGIYIQKKKMKHIFIAECSSHIQHECKERRKKWSSSFLAIYICIYAYVIYAAGVVITNLYYNYVSLWYIIMLLNICI